jgi:D-alanyl-D-alanine carboxypeptidase (penicillin-binding protein 5/6)
MASLTKIMTCLVVLDLCEDLDLDCTTFRVIVSARAASVNGTNAELTAGTEITIRDLLYGLMLPSGNDAALTLAEYFGTMLALVKESPSCQLPEDAYDP